MQTRFCRTQIPRTLECVILVFVIKTNIENFTNNNKLLFCQLSKLLKSYVSSQGSTFSKYFQSRRF
ncbi:hypothetical protein RK53_017165 [Vibrio parahaemolyticus]|uniref:Uncharacterized protein n=1 Tax=Vibrio parahaemolyticus TaxID=670 RepID=A0A249WAB7_VIBPH|nr:hypothetical protein YA91_08815 [Vibrio parahaemolyticus]ASZ53644.1 hypothetical protein YA91_08850 [Vibrio parahaemolyticus]AUT88370.1 hypothetical protein RK51_002915 [Vibrio parahaemolyticus]NCM95729.1 hypothetical protein [Vibrio parahaemolyticus]PMS96349.1 hypothetical protein C1S98_27570 [Vibrio parahaemolyticus]